MVRTFIKPDNSRYSLTLEIPEDYLGEELEVLVFKKQEGLNQTPSRKVENISDKYRAKFTLEDAKSFDNHTEVMRKEW